VGALKHFSNVVFNYDHQHSSNRISRWLPTAKCIDGAKLLLAPSQSIINLILILIRIIPVTVSNGKKVSINYLESYLGLCIIYTNFFLSYCYRQLRCCHYIVNNKFSQNLCYITKFMTVCFVCMVGRIIAVIRRKTVLNYQCFIMLQLPGNWCSPLSQHNNTECSRSVGSVLRWSSSWQLGKEMGKR